MSLSIIILAAGKGKRMRSVLPKVLHKLAGKPLLEYVVTAASRILYREIYVVVGDGADEVRNTLQHLDVKWVDQSEQLGTGHAVLQAINDVPASDDVLILYGDVPLITHTTLKKLISAAEESGISLLTQSLQDPSGYGRIIRDTAGEVSSIVEQKDATPEQLEVTEVNTGMLVVKAKWLKRWLSLLDNDNAQQEYYLTDVVSAAVSEKLLITTIQPDSPMEVKGVNDRAQLAELERYTQLMQAEYMMSNGVTFMDPGRFDCRGEIETGKDVIIDVNVVVEGTVKLGTNVSIGPNCYIKDAEIADDVEILANSIIDNAVIGKRCSIGPFARIRPDTRLSDDVKIGNFVELKKAEVGSGSKINHLSYIGDTEIGKDTNVGAGTITCNYDGANKHKTVIGDDVHIGSNTALIAPVVVGDHATIGAGTTITRDVETGTLEVNKLERKVSKDWQRPKKKSD